MPAPVPERFIPQPAETRGSQGIVIPGLGGERDAEILSLLVPATLAVFLDPAMALIDTGACLQPCQWTAPLMRVNMSGEALQ